MQPTTGARHGISARCVREQYREQRGPRRRAGTLLLTTNWKVLDADGYALKPEVATVFTYEPGQFNAPVGPGMKEPGDIVFVAPEGSTMLYLPRHR